METLKNKEDTILMFHVDANSVIANGEAPKGIVLLCADVDGERLLATELDRVRNQVLEKLRDLDWIAMDCRHLFMCDFGSAALLDRKLEILDRVVEGLKRLNGLKFLLLRADAGRKGASRE